MSGAQAPSWQRLLVHVICHAISYPPNQSLAKPPRSRRTKFAGVLRKAPEVPKSAACCDGLLLDRQIQILGVTVLSSLPDLLEVLRLPDQVGNRRRQDEPLLVASSIGVPGAAVRAWVPRDAHHRISLHI